MRRRTSSVSEKKRLANQRNAKKSTGPKTARGKKRSSQNAITHGVFCQEISFLKEDRPLMIELRREFIRSLKPQTVLELAFVDAIVENHWKLRRLRISESVAHEWELREYLKEENKDFETEMKTKNDPDYCAVVAAIAMMQRDPDNLEKYTRLQQRLQNMIHRNLKELRLLRENQKELDALPPSPFEATVDDVKYGIEDGKALEEIYDPPQSAQEVTSAEVEVQKADDSPERSQLDSDRNGARCDTGFQPVHCAPGSKLPAVIRVPTPPARAGSPCHECGPQTPSSKASEGEGLKPDASPKIENEPTEFRNYDGDTTCDPSWAAKPAPVMRRY
jgi:hypothetical protein